MSMHVTGACLAPSKTGTIPVIGPHDTNCGCASAIEIAARSAGLTADTFEKAQSNRYYGKILMFDGRAAEAFPHLLAALKYFETTYGRESLDALVMRADVAFAYGCTTEKTGQSPCQRGNGSGKSWRQETPRTKTILLPCS